MSWGGGASPQAQERKKPRLNRVKRSLNKRLISKQTAVQLRWGSETQKFGFFN